METNLKLCPKLDADDVDGKIHHLMVSYGFTRWEAMEYLYYEPYDPLDWLNSAWEEPCSLPPY
jgi:hypothetical protein